MILSSHLFRKHSKNTTKKYVTFYSDCFIKGKSSEWSPSEEDCDVVNAQIHASYDASTWLLKQKNNFRPFILLVHKTP